MILRMQTWRLILKQAALIKAQRQEFEKMEMIHQLELQRVHLEYTRNLRDLVEQFFIVQESGTDARDDLLDGLRDLQDEVARLEEHYG